jgi:DNA-directed RNA polymerase subunit RPC12/RpoP
MQVACPDCRKQFKLREDKLPETGTFRIACPGCSGEIVIERKSPPRESAAKAETNRVAGAADPEVFPPGVRVAFVFAEQAAVKETLKTVLQNRGYALSSAQSVSEAMAKMRMNRYHLVCIEHGEAGKGVLDIIDSWPGSRRREVNVVLVGDASPSLDPAVSFKLGVNSWLNRRDRDRFGELFDQVEDGYARYRDPWDAATES